MIIFQCRDKLDTLELCHLENLYEYVYVLSPEYQ